MTERTQASPTAGETRNRILDAAEGLFIDKGFAATSLRAIAARAGVNLAAAHYHFGSKEGLFAATIHRHTQPIRDKRWRELDAVLRDGQPVTVERVMRAFLTPLFDGSVSPSLPRLMGRLFAEPRQMVGELLEKEFGSTAERFVQALQQALPAVDATELRWRFNFSIGAMVQLLNFEDFPGNEPLQPEARGRAADTTGFDRLLAYVTAGITQ